MRFIVIVSVLVLLFVGAFLLFPYAGQIVSSLTPKPVPKLVAWVDQESPPSYDPDTCSLSVQWTLANDGDTAKNVKVRLGVYDSSAKQLIASQVEEVGTIEKGQQSTRNSNITGVCAEPGKDIAYQVTVSVLNYSA